MTTAISPNLFEARGDGPVEASLGWIEQVLFGEIALGLCVLAVALVGALMLTGRWPLRTGLRVLLGCFVLLGAPVIATGLLSTGLLSTGSERGYASPSQEPAYSLPPREDLTPAEFDPRSGA